jgi:hypothetical protein
MLAAQQAAQQRLAAARPSSQNLPPIVKLPVERVLVAGPIAGHPCGRHFQWEVPGIEFVPYTAEYKRSETAGDGEVSFADVTVRLYPNSDWAVYATKEGISNLEALNSKTVTTVTKFGNKVIMNTLIGYPNGDGDLYFYWASGSRFVQVTFHATEEDEFLKEYLILYPSTLSSFNLAASANSEVVSDWRSNRSLSHVDKDHGALREVIFRSLPRRACFPRKISKEISPITTANHAPTAALISQRGVSPTLCSTKGKKLNVVMCS